MLELFFYVELGLTTSRPFCCCEFLLSSVCTTIYSVVCVQQLQDVDFRYCAFYMLVVSYGLVSLSDVISIIIIIII